MTADYFGQYLLEQGLTTRERLATALAVQAKSRLPVGALALRKGHLTHEQVTTIHREQRVRNNRFLEIAVELGFLSEATVKLLLEEQKSHRIRLGDALVQAEVLQPEVCISALEAFMDLEADREANVESAVTAARSPVIVRAFLETTHLLLGRFGIGHVKAVGGHPEGREATLPGWRVDIDITGAWVGSYSLSASPAVVKTITATMLEQPVEELDELCEDCFKEFVNIVVGQTKGLLPDPTNFKMGLPKLTTQLDGPPIHVNGASFNLSLAVADGLEPALVAVADAA